MWNPMLSQEEKIPGYIRGFVRRFYQISIDYRGTLAQPGRIAIAVPSKNGILYGVAQKVDEPQKVLKILDKQENDGCQKMIVKFSPKKDSMVSERNSTLTFSENNSLISFQSPYVSKKTSHTKIHRSLQQGPSKAYEILERRSTASDNTRMSFISNTSKERIFKQIVQIPSVECVMFAGNLDHYLYSAEPDLDEIVQQISVASGSAGSNSEYVFKLAKCMREYWPHIHDEHLFSIEERLRTLAGLQQESDSDEDCMSIVFS